MYALGADRTRTAILAASHLHQQISIVGIFGFCKCSMFQFQQLCYMNVRMVNASFQVSNVEIGCFVGVFSQLERSQIMCCAYGTRCRCDCMYMHMYIYTILKLRSESWKEHSPFSSKNQEALSTDDSIHARALGCDVLESKRTE